MKTKLLSLLLAASVLLAAFPMLGFAAGPKDDRAAAAAGDEEVIFEENFDDKTNGAPIDLENGQADSNYQVLQHGENHSEMSGQGSYGSFKYGNWHKIGWNLDEKYQGIKHGKVHVAFDFSSSQPTSVYCDSNATGLVGLGQTDVNHETLSLINIMGAKNGGVVAKNDPEDEIKREIYTLGLWNQASVTKISPDYSVTKDKWYRYDGTVDLDTHAYSFTVTPLDEAEKTEKGEASYSTDSIPAGGGALSSGQKRWSNWPSAEFALNSFSITEMLDVDNIKVSYIQPSAVPPTTLSFDGGGTCSIYSDTAALTFGQSIASVADGAVTFGETPITGGTLSEDRQSYIFDIPENETIISGTEYTVKVDNSKIDTELEKLIGEGTDEIKFTVDGWEQSIYSQDFSDAGLKAYNCSNGRYEELTEASFKVEDGHGVFGGNLEYNRMGFSLGGKHPNRGVVKVKFRFMRPTVSDKHPFVAIGSNNDNAHMDVISLLAIGSDADQADDHAGVLSQNGNAANRELANDGAQLEIKRDEWYDYEALIDMDTRSFEAKVEGVGKNDTEKKVYTYSASNMTPTPSSGGANWGYWPNVTDMKYFMVMNGAFCIDDLDISYADDPILAQTESGIEAKAVAHSAGKTSLLIGQFDQNGAAASVDIKDITLEPGRAAVLKSSAAAAEGAASAKGFVWSENLSPLCPVSELTLSAPE